MIVTAHLRVKVVQMEKSDCRTDDFIIKAEVIVDYNKHMRAVDKTDTILSTVECVQKSTKWYKKLFFHIVDMSKLNAHKLYQSKNNIKISFAKFHLGLIEEIVQTFYEIKPNIQEIIR